MARQRIRLLTALVAAGIAVGHVFGGEAPQDRPGLFRQLQEMAARRPEYSKETGERLLSLVTPLWDSPDYRHRVAHVLNANQGHLDAIMNRVFLDEERAAGVDLANFAQVDPKLYRGGQPSETGIRKLAQLGIKTVVNLRLEDNSEAPLVKAAGMEYVHLPVPDTDAPSYGQVNEFLGLMHSAASGKVYVHCAAGAHRTGTMVALWRIERGWTAEKALAEARQYGFQEEVLAVDRQAALIRGFVRRRPPVE